MDGEARMKDFSRMTPEGTRDYLYEECQIRHEMEQKATALFLSRGFREVKTPGLEYYDVFDPSFSGIGQDVMFKMSGRSGRILVMRPDSTLPVARLAATRLKNEEKPLRLFYTQPVYRSHPGLSGQSSEDVQSGVEMLGAGGFRADLEILVLAAEVLGACAPGFRLEIGDAGFFRELTRTLPVSGEVLEKIRGAVEFKNYGALDECLKGLGGSENVRALRALPGFCGGEEMFREAEPYCGGKLRKSLGSLRRLYRSLSGLGLGDRLTADLGLVERNDYYTGVIFSAYLEGCGDAVLRGGRYDGLPGHFGESMPAVGFAMDLDAVGKAALKRRGDPGLEAVDVLVHGQDGYELSALRHAEKLIREGLRCETSVFRTEEEAVAYAEKRGIRRLDVVGPEVRTIPTGRNVT